MASIVHLIAFVIIWPISPAIFVIVYDIESWIVRFVIFGLFGPLAFIGAALVTLAVSSEDRKQFRDRWMADDRRDSSKTKDSS